MVLVERSEPGHTGDQGYAISCVNHALGIIDFECCEIGEGLMSLPELVMGQEYDLRRRGSLHHAMTSETWACAQ